ncbi:MAG: ABC transporter ATP-binding protein [Desulfomonile tiedjei]|uniref:ABC transporter ATP-binding protein n=1 Tax=Desulfomonile tiedjei TaxID=2358 RepID=A0A9D6Z6D8_9BACT|nr:ABC transporter ATP-binding protein [Desulfomonile tiedjei]
MLEVRGLVTNYGPIRALDGIDLEVMDGEIVTLIGANGAGKTTLLKSIMKLVKPLRGQIRFRGTEISGLSTEAIVRKGMVLVPEGRAILRRMTVLENLLMGAYISNDAAQIGPDLEQVFARFPVLGGKQKNMAAALSGGEQQMLAIGRGLMARPELLILDEPSLGLAPLMVQEIFSIIGHLHQSGTTILLVEQNAKKALQVSDRAYVLELGSITLSGRCAELLKRDEVRSAYLGESA